MSNSKTILFLVLVLITLFFVTIYLSNKIIDSASWGRLYSDADSIPSNKVGILLGTSKFVKSGNVNQYYTYRINAATELMKAKKIKYLIISGDNSEKDYNEPRMMKEDLIKSGIDSSQIFLDYAGFRTFDSMIRLKKVFRQDSVTIISQEFHNERAIYIAHREGMYAIGFNARDVGDKYGITVQLRERFARVKVFLDYLFGKEPKFLGEEVKIP